jgi:hypothetical protein
MATAAGHRGGKRVLKISIIVEWIVLWVGYPTCHVHAEPYSQRSTRRCWPCCASRAGDDRPFLDNGWTWVRALFLMCIASTAVRARPVPMPSSSPRARPRCHPSDILVIDRCKYKHACASGSRLRGAQGRYHHRRVVTDIGELRGCGVPVWARGLSMRKLGLGGFCVPVSCGGVMVRLATRSLPTRRRAGSRPR